ncbi:hypothetical protein FACS1894125_2080 [Actinomycetota bacterium]|nr:hypothetical protein FACS1894125_2080 [Actinomycetota bacterium]
MLAATVIRVNDITGQMPEISNITKVENADELLGTINSKVQSEIFPQSDFVLAKYNLNSYFSKDFVNSEYAHSVKINNTFYFVYPSYKSIANQLEYWLTEQKLPITQDVQSGIKQVASNVSIRYLGFGDQLKSAEDERLEQVYAQQDVLIISTLGFFLLTTLSLLLLQNLSFRSSFATDTPIKNRHIAQLFFVTLVIVLAASLPLSSTLLTNIFPSTYTIDPELNPVQKMDMSDFAINMIDEPQKPDYMEHFGQIDIDSQNIHQQIIEGTTEESLKLSPGHMSFSAWPGELGPVVIAGHNMTQSQGAWQKDFGKIFYLQPGELFKITTDYGQFVYQVTDNHVQSADSYDLLAKTTDRSKRYAILYSCYPIDSGNTPDRTFVTAEQISGPVVKINTEGAADAAN